MCVLVSLEMLICVDERLGAERYVGTEGKVVMVGSNESQVVPYGR